VARASGNFIFFIFFEEGVFSLGIERHRFAKPNKNKAMRDAAAC